VNHESDWVSYYWAGGSLAGDPSIPIQRDQSES